jgi:hypothetical protein
MKLVKLRIRKKTLVPTKRQLVHEWRSDWRTVGIIEYSDGHKFFRHISPYGICETDAQFAKWLKDTFGVGIYSILGHQKGREGFYAFLKIECLDSSFARLSKNITQEQKEILDLAVEARKLNRQLKHAANEDEKSEIHSEISNIKDDIGLTKEIEELYKNKAGPAPYLRSTMPVYKYHEYENYGVGVSVNNEKHYTNKYKRMKQGDYEKEEERKIIEKKKLNQEYNEIW